MNCLKLGIPAIYLIPQMHHRDHGIDDNFVINCIVTFSSNFKRLQYRFLRYALFGVVEFYCVSAVLVLSVASAMTKRPQETMITKEREMFLRVRSYFGKTVEGLKVRY